MFTQRCFIRKNNEEIINKVLTLGNRTTKFINKDYDIIIATPKTIMCGDSSFKDDKYVIDFGYTDCGTNEELFLAIAALRDDSDRFQWFVDDYDDNIWQKSEWNNANFTKAHKATVEELIKHFSV